ncbi:trypsin-like serine protease [Hypoxylon sp. EC38]|nr:trypsin-like serine protease [Hypoxylon sp. EC38]
MAATSKTRGKRQLGNTSQQNPEQSSPSVKRARSSGVSMPSVISLPLPTFPEENVRFKDLLFTPEIVPNNNLAQMRQYQLLLGVAALHPLVSGMYQADKITAGIIRTEQIIRMMMERMKPVLKPRGILQGVERDLEPEDAIREAIEMSPVKEKAELDASDFSASLETLELDKRLYHLQETLSMIQNADLNIISNTGPRWTTVAWYLDGEDSDFTDIMVEDGDGDEGYFPSNPMSTLEDSDLMSGIVQLELQWNTRSGQKTSTATGWFLNDNTVVTAGHCVLNRGRRLASVQVSLGQGDDKECRYGTHVVVHWGYFRDYQVGHDLALIRIASKFAEARSFEWMSIPRNGKLNVRVIGYPSYASPKDRQTKKRNSDMQYSEAKVDCMTVRERLLQHTASTFNGSSGCPLLDDNECAIGIHSGRRRDSEKSSNLAVTFGGSNDLNVIHDTLEKFAGKDESCGYHENDIVYCLDENGVEVYTIKHI